MTRICAWCSTILGTIDDGSDRVTHGICPACSAKLEPEEDEVPTRIEPGETKRIIVTTQPITGEIMSTLEITNRGNGAIMVDGDECPEPDKEDSDEG